MLSLCHGRGITIGSFLHHTWCLVYCATWTMDVKTESSWSQNGLLLLGGLFFLPSMVPGTVFDSIPENPTLWGSFHSGRRQQAVFLLQVCRLFYWLWSCAFVVHMFFCSIFGVLQPVKLWWVVVPMNLPGLMQWLFSVPALLILPPCYAFLAGRCHVLLLLAVLHSVMGIIVFSGLLLWFLSLL